MIFCCISRSQASVKVVIRTLFPSCAFAIASFTIKVVLPAPADAIMSLFMQLRLRYIEDT